MTKSNTLHFSVVFEPEAKGAYSVYVPELPGCVTQGKDFEHAQKMAKEAIIAYLEVAHENKIPLFLSPNSPVMSTVSIEATELTR